MSIVPRLASANETAAVLGILSRRSLLSGFAAAVLAPMARVEARQAPVSLLALGCVGDGHSDDTVALRKAIDLGIPLTGEGRWYGVRNLRVTPGLDMEDVNLRAVSPKPVGALLDVTGPASVRLARFKIDRAASVGATMERSVALRIIGASGVDLEDCEVFGGGTGTGMFLIRCKAVRHQRSSIHDMTWTETYDPGHGGERIQGIRHQDCDDVELRDSRLANLTGSIAGAEAWPYQTDGLVFGNSRNFRVLGGSATRVGEAIDCAGSGFNRDFLIDGFNTDQTGSFGIKVVSSGQNGMVLNSVHREPGLAGCVTGGSSGGVPQRNVVFENIKVISPGKNRNSLWAGNLPVGFWVVPGNGPPAEDISFTGCEAVDDSGSMRYALRNESSAVVGWTRSKSSGYAVSETAGPVVSR